MAARLMAELASANTASQGIGVGRPVGGWQGDAALFWLTMLGWTWSKQAPAVGGRPSSVPSGPPPADAAPAPRE